MKAITLLYHDIVQNSDWDSSGFAGTVEARYKINEEEFYLHLQKCSFNNANFITCFDLRKDGLNLMITVDDGGKSALRISEMFDQFGWKGHFFITGNRINTTAFVTKEDIVDIHKRGHIIGSHSLTHPRLFSNLTFAQLKEEWSKSRIILEDILGSKVITASVPGGFYSNIVAKAASESGIEFLFTSEPIRKISQIGNTKVIGRYTIFDYITPEIAAAIAANNNGICFKQWAYWNTKKVGKKFFGPIYSVLRNKMIKDK